MLNFHNVYDFFNDSQKSIQKKGKSEQFTLLAFFPLLLQIYGRCIALHNPYFIAILIESLPTLAITKDSETA